MGCSPIPTVDCVNDSGNPSTAVSQTYDTTGKGLGTYYWQAQYLHGTDTNYTDGTPEACGGETDQMVDARIRITPHEATNVINNNHTVSVFVEWTTDGSTWSPVSGVGVDTSVLPAGNSATYVPSAAQNCTTAPQTTPSGTYCQVTITDGVVETVNIRAVATGFSVSGVLGTFTRSTGDASNQADCAVSPPDLTCGDAIKHWINPKTELTVSDTLIGLGADATGTVTYTVYPTATDCTNGTNGVDKTPSPNTVTGGSAPPSVSINVNPPTSGTTTYYFSAHYAGNGAGSPPTARRRLRRRAEPPKHPQISNWAPASSRGPVWSQVRCASNEGIDVSTLAGLRGSRHHCRRASCYEPAGRDIVRQRM